MGRASALITAICVGALGLAVLTYATSTHDTAAASSNEIAVDANPSTPGIDSSVTVPPGATFAIGIDVTKIAQPYNGVQFELSWPAAGLQFTGGRTQNAASPFNCQIQPNDVMSEGQEMVQDSCDAGQRQQTYTGLIETLDLKCLSLGNFTIHLVTQAEDPNFGSYLSDRGGNPIPADTVDATVTCSDATATPTPTATLCPGVCPTATNTSVPTVTPTATATLPPCSSNCGLVIDADPSTSIIDATRTVGLSSLFSIGIDNNLGGVSYQGYQVEISWSDAALDFGGSTSVSGSSPMKVCQSPNDYPGSPGGTEILQDGCEDGSGSHMYVGQVETVELICRVTGTFALHLVTYAEDSFFGSTLIDHNSNPVPTGTTDATIVCAEATATPVPSTATATATPTAISVPIRVGGEAELHVTDDARRAAPAAEGSDSRAARVLAMSLVAAVAFAIAASTLLVRVRRRR